MANRENDTKDIAAQVTIKRSGDTVSVEVSASVTRTVSYEETNKIVNGALADIKRAITCYAKDGE